MTKLRRTPEQVRLPRGFSFSAVAAGIKASGRPDLALIESSVSASAVALFTRNLVVAAPLEIGQASLVSSAGRVRAVVVNSGNANCATGRAGRLACERVCRHAARLLGVPAEEVFPSSTGIIGVPLPAEKIIAKLPDLIAARASTERAALEFAQAIMTTDKRPKIAAQRLRVGSKEVTIFGVAKGSGMIHPQLATMLVYLLTDAAATPRQLQQLLHGACDPTLNSMSVDGDTSTNDTVLLLANGESGVRVSEARVRNKFSQALGAVCQSLAEQIVSDGEGVKHVIRLFVEQASTREEALVVARTIAHSALVKTAWAGADPNWGRILAAVGRCGLPIDPSRVRIFIGSQIVCRDGVAHPFNERRAHQSLAQPECDI
ncbi:MAG TPA: bifunctional glutamate N-acetyltransferase/amino-acid acetyltransferase ArgJ, partial [Terriglobales bacterium]